MKKASESFQLIRPVLLPQAQIPSASLSCLPFRVAPCLLLQCQWIYVRYSILRRHSPPRQLEIFDTCTAARSLYPKCNDIFYNTAVSHPRDCLPCAPIVLRRHVHHALHPDSPRGSLYGSSRDSCTLSMVCDVWREGYAPETP